MQRRVNHCGSEFGEYVKTRRLQCLQWLCVSTRLHHVIFLQAERRQQKETPMQHIPTTLPKNHEFQTSVDNLIDTHIFIHRYKTISLSFHLPLPTTAKEHLCAQQYPQGSRQRYQEEEAYQVRFYQGNGP